MKDRLELMHDHVRAIHRSITGAEPPEPGDPGGRTPPTFEEVARRFSELEALGRTVPPISERVPPFSFTPPLDVSGTERDLIVELGVPGVDAGDVEVSLDGETLTITGALPELPAAGESRVCFHAEIARGPFRREARLPEPVSGRPRVEVERGIVRIRLTRAVRAPLPRA